MAYYVCMYMNMCVILTTITCNKNFLKQKKKKEDNIYSRS